MCIYLLPDIREKSSPSLKMKMWDFLGGAVVKDPPVTQGDTDSIPGWGHARGILSRLLSLSLSRACAPQLGDHHEKEVWALHGEKVHTSTKTQHSHRKVFNSRAVKRRLIWIWGNHRTSLFQNEIFWMICLNSFTTILQHPVILEWARTQSD